MSMNVNLNPDNTYRAPPPPPPTKEGVDGLEGKYKELESKLKDNPNDQGAKDELRKLDGETLKAIDGEQGKADGGDPATLERLDSLRQSIVDLSNKTFTSGDGAKKGSA